MSMRFGMLWPFRNPEFARVPWEQFYRSHLDLIGDSEALGFDDAWLTEHHFVDDGYSPSLFAIAGAVAARTRRLRIGTFLFLLPLHHPVGVAEDTATVDLLSEGRFDLGVGIGYRLAEFEDQGISHRNRGARMEESLDIVRRLLSDETVTIDGRFTSLRNIRISPPALQRPHPPIWVGGVADRAIERAARMGFHFLNGGQADRAAVYDEALRTHGRDPALYNVASQRVVYVAPTREQAWEIAAQPLHHLASCYLEWFSESGDAPDYDKVKITVPSVEEIIREQRFNFFGEEAIVGTPADAIEALEDYCGSMRLTHLVCAMAMPGMAPHHIRSGMELFARTVIPHFRGR